MVAASMRGGTVKRSRNVVFAEVEPEVLAWLDALPAPGDTGPNRSFHVREALRAYRLGGPVKIEAALRDLDRMRAERERETPEEIVGRWWLSLSPDVREATARVAVALQSWSRGRPFAEVPFVAPDRISPNTPQKRRK